MNKNKQNGKNQTFTLVELSIVIIIIGFIIAGISAGTSLTKQAELHAILTEMQNYKTAYNAFTIRYSAIPGDMKNAESYWPAGTNGCSITATECNGDGNGFIDYYARESYAAWRELALAGMISSAITAIPDGWNPGGGVDEILGSTIPESKREDAGYLIVGSNLLFGNATRSPWDDGLTNAVFISEVRPNESMANPVFKPEDAFNLDQKIDDAQASGTDFTGALTGNFRTIKGITYDTCLTGNNYDLTITAPTCISGFALN